MRWLGHGQQQRSRVIPNGHELRSGSRMEQQRGVHRWPASVVQVRARPAALRGPPEARQVDTKELT